MIPKKDIEKYAKGFLRAHLSDEWALHSGDYLLRRHELLIQGILFERSGYGDLFTVWHFIQPLSIVRDHFVLNVGSRLVDPNMREAWFEWSPSITHSSLQIYNSLYTQACPPIFGPLTSEDALQCITNYHVAGHFFIAYAFAILFGLAGKPDKAETYIRIALDDLARREGEWHRMGKKPPDWILSNKNSLGDLLNSLKIKDAFFTICKQGAIATSANLRLKGKLAFIG